MTRDDLFETLHSLLLTPRTTPRETPPTSAALDACLALWDELAAEGFDASGWCFTPGEVDDVDLDLDGEGGFALYFYCDEVVVWGVARNSGARHWIVRRPDGQTGKRTEVVCDVATVARLLREARP
jgi:hypothetical protein